MFGADVSPFIKAMDSIGVSSKKAGDQTAASLRNASKQLTALIESEQAAGKETKVWANELQRVNSQLATMEVNASRAAAAADALSMKQAKRRLKTGDGEAYEETLANMSANGRRSFSTDGDELLQKSVATKKRLADKIESNKRRDNYDSMTSIQRKEYEEGIAAQFEEDKEIHRQTVAKRLANMRAFQSVRLRKEAAAMAGSADDIENSAFLTRFASRRASGEGRGGGGGMASTGVIGEAVVIGREIGRGNTSRIPGSVTILAQRMGVLKYLYKSTAEGAEALAAAWDKQAAVALATASALTRKAMASREDAISEKASSKETWVAVKADEARAVSARAAATQIAKKAESSALEAETAAAAAPKAVTAFGLITGAVIGLGIGAWLAMKRFSGLVDSLRGVDDGIFHVEYMARHLQSSQQVAEAWRNIKIEVDKTIASYNSVASVAERIADLTKMTFDHQMQMLEVAKQTEMQQAGSSRIKQEAVEAKYAAEEFNKRREQRESEVSALEQKSGRMIKSGEKKFSDAESMRVREKILSPEVAAGELENKKRLADKSQAAVDKMLADSALSANLITKETGAMAWRAFQDSGISFVNLFRTNKYTTGNKEVDKADAALIKTNDERQAAYKAQVESNRANELKRQKMQALIDSGGAEINAGKAGGLSADSLRKKYGIENEQDYERVSAGLRAYAGRPREMTAMSTTERERVGAYGGPGVRLLNVAQLQLAAIKRTNDILLRLAPPPRAAAQGGFGVGR